MLLSLLEDPLIIGLVKYILFFIAGFFTLLAVAGIAAIFIGLDELKDK